MSSGIITHSITSEPLGKHHHRAAFSSGVPALDRYLQKQARQDANRNVAAAFVLCEAETTSIIGYYTLSAAGVDIGEIPEDVARKLPHYSQIPAVRLGRLAVDQAYAGQGFGKRVLLDALRRAWERSDEIAAAMVIVDAKNDPAAQFYEHFGFGRFPGQVDKLFMPMQTVAALFE